MGEKKKEKKDKEKEKEEKATVRSAPDGSDNNGPICEFTWEAHFHCQVLIFPSLPVLQFILQCTVSYTVHCTMYMVW